MYVKRELEDKINNYMDRKEIIAVIGTRQCGKTTMVSRILEKYSNVNFITFEDVEKKLLFEEDIDSFIALHVRDFDYLFIDEVQYAENSGKQLKYIFDTEKIKMIISGSSSTDLSIKSLKYLVGRIMVFELYPFSFREFLSFRNNRLYRLFLKKAFKNTVNKKILNYIHEYMQYGGYPRVVISDSPEEKRIVLKNIYNTYLLREIKELLQLSNNDKLIKLLRALSFQMGNMIHYNELSDTTGFDFNTLKRYLQILEQTFICSRCYTYFTNKRKELVKTPKIYFIDHGFRNQCAGDFKIDQQRIGQYYENLIYSEYLKKDIVLKYWRTKSKAEVDFIKDNHIPIEVKKRAKITKSFLSFISKYNPNEGYIVSEVEK
ncbi:MAG TPA: ATP-binding protein, partial [Candidatus Krumholzibacteriaceae bacterium]|nr:ATP-binding protein [Candidatus Krumholzibacteriaceae bacterium]